MVFETSDTSMINDGFVSRFLAPFFGQASQDHSSDKESALHDADHEIYGTNIIQTVPGYAVSKNNGTFQIAFHAFPGVKPSDIIIQLEDDGRMLHISGDRISNCGGCTCLTRFEKRFLIGQNVNTRKLKAIYHENGVLIVSAPMLDQKRQSLAYK